MLPEGTRVRLKADPTREGVVVTYEEQGQDGPARTLVVWDHGAGQSEHDEQELEVL